MVVAAARFRLLDRQAHPVVALDKILLQPEVLHHKDTQVVPVSVLHLVLLRQAVEVLEGLEVKDTLRQHTTHCMDCLVKTLWEVMVG